MDLSFEVAACCINSLLKTYPDRMQFLPRVRM